MNNPNSFALPPSNHLHTTWASMDSSIAATYASAAEPTVPAPVLPLMAPMLPDLNSAAAPATAEQLWSSYANQSLQPQQQPPQQQQQFASPNRSQAQSTREWTRPELLSFAEPFLASAAAASSSAPSAAVHAGVPVLSVPPPLPFPPPSIPMPAFDASLLDNNGYEDAPSFTMHFNLEDAAPAAFAPASSAAYDLHSAPVCGLHGAPMNRPMVMQTATLAPLAGSSDVGYGSTVLATPFQSAFDQQLLQQQQQHQLQLFQLALQFQLQHELQSTQHQQEVQRVLTLSNQVPICLRCEAPARMQQPPRRATPPPPLGPLRPLSENAQHTLHLVLEERVRIDAEGEALLAEVHAFQSKKYRAYVLQHRDQQLREQLAKLGIKPRPTPKPRAKTNNLSSSNGKGEGDGRKSSNGASTGKSKKKKGPSPAALAAAATAASATTPPVMPPPTPARPLVERAQGGYKPATEAEAAAHAEKLNRMAAAGGSSAVRPASTPIASSTSSAVPQPQSASTQSALPGHTSFASAFSAEQLHMKPESASVSAPVAGVKRKKASPSGLDPTRPITIDGEEEGGAAGTQPAKKKQRAPSRAASSSSGGVVHVGITCDGCEMNPIVGPRFRCKQCWSGAASAPYTHGAQGGFDLCAACTQTVGQAHFAGSHEFERIDTPLPDPRVAPRPPPRPRSRAARPPTLNSYHCGYTDPHTGVKCSLEMTDAYTRIAHIRGTHRAFPCNSRKNPLCRAICNSAEVLATHKCDTKKVVYAKTPSLQKGKPARLK